MRGMGMRRRQEGIAVITAMLVVTIATVLAVELAWQTNLDLRRTEGTLTWDQAHQFAYGAEAYAGKLLEEKLRDQAGETATYSRKDELTACGGFQFTLDQGGMSGGVCDLQARFNLNNLVKAGPDRKLVRDDVTAKQFRRLLNAISAFDPDVDIDPDVVETIVESTIDWIDPDSDTEFNGAEADAYTSLQPPYRAANFWFTNVSELRAVRGVTPEIFLAVAPFVAALPVGQQQTQINVNTASIPVLMSLGDDVTAANAAQWVEASADEPFTDTTQFTQLADHDMTSFIGVASNYFELRGLVSIGSTRLGMYSLLEYTGQAVVPRLRQFDVIDAVPVAQVSEDDETAAREEVDEPDE